jgi:hypothetical protein
MIRLYLFPATFTLWAFIPFFPRGKVQSLLGSIHPKIPKGWGDGGEKDMESDKYGREKMMNFQGTTQ